MSENVKSIYFGGGTPSILEKNDIESIIDSLRDNFNIDEVIEITLECNPDDVSLKKVNDWISINVNRISLGVQSFNDTELHIMNRSHDSKIALRSLDIISKSYQNYSVDLIYGMPNSSLETWKFNIETLLEYNIPHITTYALQVEDKTALKSMIKKKKIKNIDEKVQEEQYYYTNKFLKKLNYINYEFSSYSKPGFECKNNLAYWNRDKYLGFGPSAHSYINNFRKWNVSNNSKYLDGIKKNELSQFSEKLSQNDIANEMIMVGLRTKEGFDLNKIKSMVSEKNINFLNKQVEFKISNGILIKKNNKIHVAENYKFITDGVSSDLFLID